MPRLTLPTRAWSTAPGLGVLGVTGAEIATDSRPPSADLAGVVERFWRMRWDVHDSSKPAQLVLLPLPEAGLVAARGKVARHGVLRHPRTWRLTGQGTAVGMVFRPGAAATVLGEDVPRLTDRICPLPDTGAGLDSRRLADAVITAGASELFLAARCFERHLRDRMPFPYDPARELMADVIEVLRVGGSFTRVAELSSRFHLSPRTLQRAFQKHLGVTPKWLLSRYRLHDAAARLQTMPPERWSYLALDLGYFDDSHFARDFARALGMTPITYARAVVRGQQAPCSVIGRPMPPGRAA
ncbi:helix-turn-helix domain-containing protein [Yinghuangia sp. YIM S09857]|uniref:helix-turn-helix domain-containing protein n=1 Tax=Yinghuangia sp. YIM S09857 TaxID=3436929 RepID=UPI003F53ACD5